MANRLQGAVFKIKLCKSMNFSVEELARRIILSFDDDKFGTTYTILIYYYNITREICQYYYIIIIITEIHFHRSFLYARRFGLKDI